MKNLHLHLQISPVIYGPTAEYVHHIVAYLCTSLNDTHVGASQKCVGTGNINIDLCRKTGVLFAGWAVGGTVSSIYEATFII